MDAMLKSLKIAIFDVMETMYFFIPDEDNAAIGDRAGGYNVFIGISGDPGYLITLTSDTHLAVSMTSLLLGIDENDVDTDTIHKCLKETANIIAGSFLLGFNGEENRNVTLPYMNKTSVFGGIPSLDKREINVSFNGYGVTATLETIDAL